MSAHTASQISKRRRRRKHKRQSTHRLTGENGVECIGNILAYDCHHWPSRVCHFYCRVLWRIKRSGKFRGVGKEHDIA